MRLVQWRRAMPVAPDPPRACAARVGVDGAFMLGAAMCAGALAWSAPVEAGISTLLALGIVLFGARSGGASRTRALVLALACSATFVVGAARVRLAIEAFEDARAALESDGRWPAGCTLKGRVLRSPTQLGDALRVDLDVAEGSCDAGSFRVPVTLHVPLEVSSDLARGDVVAAMARLSPPYRFWNAATGDPAPRATRRGVLLTGSAQDLVREAHGRGIGHAIDNLRASIRARIVATFPPQTEALARALVLGEGDLPTEDQQAFRKSGLSHLLAVSGMHLVLVVASFVALVRVILVRVTSLARRIDVGRIAALCGIPAAFCYAELAGASGSAERAAWMMTAGFLARALGRRPEPWRALGLSMVAMTVQDPLSAYDLSFLLSVAATVGLVALGPPLARALTHATQGRVPVLVKPLAATASASIACAPLLAGMGPELSFAGLSANVAAVPVGEAAALPLCLIHALLAPWPSAERGAALAGSGALSVVRAIANVFASLSWTSVRVPEPTAGQLGLLFVATIAVLTIQRRRLAILALAAALLVGLELRQRALGAPHGILRVTFLDVGQGDAALVDLPNGQLMLVDAGGLVGSPIDTGARVIAPILRARRRSVVDFVVLSHPHPDHFGGMRAGLEAASVGEFWDTGQGEREGVRGGYADLLETLRARHVRLLHPRDLCGTRALGGLLVDVLAPCPEPSSDLGPNDNSFVLRLRYGARSVLFVGDAERSEEEGLVRTASRELRADVLKVGHHGSRTSSSLPFLRAVRPKVAVVSCGVRNRYGHPHPITLAALDTERIRTLRIDREGAVTVVTDGTTLDAQSLSTTPMYGKLRYFSAKSSP